MPTSAALKVRKIGLGNVLIDRLSKPPRAEHGSLDEVVRQHSTLGERALELLQKRVDTDDAFALLQDKSRFEIYELMKIHEAILFQKLDRSNFRKMFLRSLVDRQRVKEIGKYDASGKPKTALYCYLERNDER